MTKYQVAANIAFFLLERTGSVLGQWSGRLTADEQRDIFGIVIGKGMLHIDGETETVQHIVKRCFGLDYEVTFDTILAHWEPATKRHADRKAEEKKVRAVHAARIDSKFNHQEH